MTSAAPSPLPRIADLALASPVLVVGGDGFLGSHMLEQLLAALPAAHCVHVLDLQQRQYHGEPRVKYHVGSLLDSAFVRRTLTENQIKTVIHAASPPHGRSRDFYWQVNVDGTRVLVDAMVATSTPNLVYTSSASVVFNGEDVLHADESRAYCRGEQLRTVALRPSGIFGPRDAQAIPGFVDTVATGKSHMVVGDGKNMADFTYVGNVAHAHLLACARLAVAGDAQASSVAGKAMFVTNAQPIPFWEFNRRFVRAFLKPGDPRAARAGTVHVPRWVLLPLAYLVAALAAAVKPFVKWEPLFTPFRIRLATATRTFKCDRAREVLGYEPIVDLDEGIKRAAAWARTVSKWRPVWDVDVPEQARGSGKVAPAPKALAMEMKPLSASAEAIVSGARAAGVGGEPVARAAS